MSLAPSLLSLPAIPTPNQGHSGDVPTPARRPDGTVDSMDILRGQKAVDISHNGVLYRLQATRLGKLILTK